MKHTKHIDVNFVIQTPQTRPTDRELFFGDEDAVFVDENVTMVDLLVMSGICKSKGQARKNAFVSLFGPDGKDQDKEKAVGMEIPNGFSEWTSGKLKHWITVIKIT